MKLRLDHLLWPGLLFALFSIFILFSLHRSLTVLDSLNGANVRLSQINSAVSRQQETARSIRSSSSMRDVAERNSLAIRDELNQMMHLDANTRMPDKQMAAFVQVLQQDLNQLEGYMQDLRTGYEASLNKVLEVTADIQNKIQEHGQKP